MSGNGSHGKSHDRTPQDHTGVKRRDLLLSGSSLVAASALAATGLRTTAQAQSSPHLPRRQRASGQISW
jgi:hypothetical protein